MKNETLWIRLPLNEKREIESVIESCKNLPSLTINQFIAKLKNNEAESWIQVFDQYNSISSIRNMNSSEMLDRSQKVRDKFEERGYPQLKDRTFEPQELLALVILCYSNPNLIGPKLSKALNDNNVTDIEKEILENSAYSKAQKRVLPFASNLRLINYALFAKNSTVLLPVNMINRIVNETTANYNYSVIMTDQQFGLTSVVNLMKKERIEREREKMETQEGRWLDQVDNFNELMAGSAARSEGSIARAKRDQSEKEDSYAVLQSLQSHSHDHGIVGEESGDSLQFAISPFPPQIDRLDNGSMVTSLEALKSDGTNNAASSSYGNALIIGSLALFQIARNSPVGSVVRNIGKDLVTASKHVGGFFSKNAECEAQEKTVLLSPKAGS